jgi:predicted ester cyclase
VNTRNYGLFSDVVATDCVDHDPGPGQVPGPDGYRALFTEMRQAFPDLKVELAELVADEEAIAFAYTLTGTQDGTLMGIAPTGRKVNIRGLQISKFRDGKMVERWAAQTSSACYSRSVPAPFLARDDECTTAVDIERHARVREEKVILCSLPILAKHI